MELRLIHTSDWHFGAGYNAKKWPEELAKRRRAERQGAVLQILSHAQMVKADFLVLAGDVCDFPEDMPAAVRGGLEQLQQHGCVPLLFFTNKGHDRNRDWWSGAAVGPLKGEPTGGHDKLPHAISLGGVLFSAHDEVPAPDQVIARAHEGDLCILLLHAQLRNRSALQRLQRLQQHVSYAACGDCHTPTTLVPDFAYYSGSPSFRDLSSFDPGPRSFLDVRIAAGKTPHVEVVPIRTPLSAALTITDGRVTKVSPADSDSTARLDTALASLARKYDYIRVEIANSDVALVSEAARALAGNWRVLPWSDKTVLMARGI